MCNSAIFQVFQIFCAIERAKVQSAKDFSWGRHIRTAGIREQVRQCAKMRLAREHEKTNEPEVCRVIAPRLAFCLS